MNIVEGGHGYTNISMVPTVACIMSWSHCMSVSESSWRLNGTVFSFPDQQDEGEELMKMVCGLSVEVLRCSCKGCWVRKSRYC